MIEIVLLLSLIIGISGILGFIIGRQAGGSGIAAQLEEAYDQGRAELAVEKAEISKELRQQLALMKEGLQQSTEAYELVLRTVERRMPETGEGGRPYLESKTPEQLQLEFEQVRQHDSQKTAISSFNAPFETAHAHNGTDAQSDSNRPKLSDAFDPADSVSDPEETFQAVANDR